MNGNSCWASNFFFKVFRPGLDLTKNLEQGQMFLAFFPCECVCLSNLQTNLRPRPKLITRPQNKTYKNTKSFLFARTVDDLELVPLLKLKNLWPWVDLILQLPSDLTCLCEHNYINILMSWQMQAARDNNLAFKYELVSLN